MNKKMINDCENYNSHNFQHSTYGSISATTLEVHKFECDSCDMKIMTTNGLMGPTITINRIPCKDYNDLNKKLISCDESIIKNIIE